MADAFLGEIKMFSMNYAPQGWALCNGQFLPINQNQALFSLLGTTYGGNGQTTFALPDLRGRAPLHEGSGFLLGQRGGEESHTVSMSEMPTHAHVLNATTTNGTTQIPAGNLLAPTASQAYHAPSGLTAFAPEAVTNTGGSQPHENRQPYLTLTFCIALIGIFPSQN